MSNEGIHVTGIPELSRALKALDVGVYRELRLGMKQIADHVVGVAQQRMPFRSGIAARSLKPRATQKGAGIAFPAGGSESADSRDGYYPWLDFGGTTGRGHVANGHNGYGGSIVRPIVKGGRFLYPAIGQSKEYIADKAYDLIEDVAHRNGFETEGF